MYEKGFFGSLSNMNIIRFEIIFLLLLMIINIIVSTKKERQEFPYSSFHLLGRFIDVNSYEKICEEVKKRGDEPSRDMSDVKIAFSTTGYHVFRSGHIAYSQGIKAVGIGNKTKWYFHTNALIREFVANMNIEKKRHIEKLVILILFLIILLILSYQFKIM